MTQSAKVFQNGRSQAIRIPKEFRVHTSEVYIEKVGETLVIRPKPQNKWDSFFRKPQVNPTNPTLSNLS